MKLLLVHDGPRAKKPSKQAQQKHEHQEAANKQKQAQSMDGRDSKRQKKILSSTSQATSKQQAQGSGT